MRRLIKFGRQTLSLERKSKEHIGVSRTFRCVRLETRSGSISEVKGLFTKESLRNLSQPDPGGNYPGASMRSNIRRDLISFASRIKVCMLDGKTIALVGSVNRLKPISTCFTDRNEQRVSSIFILIG